MGDFTLELSAPQSKFFMSQAKFVNFCAGLGCLRGSTKVVTEHGLVPIDEITSPMRVLSWNEKNNRYELALSAGSFPEGRDYLYRVVTQQGEFVASGSHQLFCADHTYQPVNQLRVGDELSSSAQFLRETIVASVPLSSHGDDQHSMQTIANWMGDCADEARRYGQQLHVDQVDDPFHLPLSIDAQEFCQTHGLSFYVREGENHELTPDNNRLSQSGDLSGTDDYQNRLGSLLAGVAGRAFSLYFARTWPYIHHLLAQRLRNWSFFRRIKTLFARYRTYGSIDRPSKCSSSETVTKILSISRLDVQEPYYDMQVLDTNNYVTEDGAIHHNSGKTFVGTGRLLATMINNPACNTLYMAPTHSLIKSIFYPSIEELLKELEMPYTLNKSDSVIDIEGLGNVYCRSMTDPSTLIGINILSGFLDEIDTVPTAKAELVLQKVIGRMRQVSPAGTKGQVFVFSTPEGYKFSYLNWKKKPLADSELIIASTYSNEHNLAPGYIQTLKDTYPAALFDAYVNGIYTNLASGTVYSSFDRKTCDCDSVYRQGEELHCGVDFNVQDMSCVIGVYRYSGQNQSKKELHIIDTLFHLHDTDELAEVLRNKYPASPIYVYPDSSGRSTSSKSASKSDFTILNRAGLHTRAPSKNPLIKDRVMSMNAAFEKHHIRVNVTACEELTESLEQQVYNENTGQPEKLVNSSIDDQNDSLGYLCHYMFPIVKLDSRAKSLSGF